MNREDASFVDIKVIWQKTEMFSCIQIVKLTLPWKDGFWSAEHFFHLIFSIDPFHTFQKFSETRIIFFKKNSKAVICNIKFHKIILNDSDKKKTNRRVRVFSMNFFSKFVSMSVYQSISWKQSRSWSAGLACCHRANSFSVKLWLFSYPSV